MEVGDKFMLTDDAIANYGDDYSGRIFTVSYVSNSKDDHQGYDEGVGQPLYDAEELTFSVYEFEVIPV